MNPRKGKRLSAEGAGDLQLSVDGEVDDFLELVEDLQAQAAIAQEVSRALQQELEESRAREREVRDVADARAGEIDRYVLEVGALEAAVKEADDAMQVSDQERLEAAMEIRRLHDEATSLRTEGEAREASIRQMEKDADTSAREAEYRERRLAEATEDHEQRQAEIRRQLEQRDRELYEANAVIEDLSEERERLLRDVADLDRTRAKLDKLRAKMGCLRDRMLGGLDAQPQHPIGPSSQAE